LLLHPAVQSKPSWDGAPVDGASVDGIAVPLIVRNLAVGGGAIDRDAWLVVLSLVGGWVGAVVPRSNNRFLRVEPTSADRTANKRLQTRCTAVTLRGGWGAAEPPWLCSWKGKKGLNQQ
jgi:hypothetical protein